MRTPCMHDMSPRKIIQQRQSVGHCFVLAESYLTFKFKHAVIVRTCLLVHSCPTESGSFPLSICQCTSVTRGASTLALLDIVDRDAKGINHLHIEQRTSAQCSPHSAPCFAYCLTSCCGQRGLIVSSWA